jgi:PLD-like domain
MGRVFSNGLSGDFVFNPFINLVAESTRIHVATPFVNTTEDLLQAAKNGKSVDLLVGLNASTSPQALSDVHEVPNLAIRYLTRRFHAKIYLFDNAALVGSSNLTDGGLRSNREATIRLDEPDDIDAIEELRELFFELWNSARVLTTETLKEFASAHKQFNNNGSTPDLRIEAAIGVAEPPNINVLSNRNTPERVFLEQLRRQVYEQYRPSFNEVTKLLEEHSFHRPELKDIGTSHETNRFLNWVRRTYVPGDEVWKDAPLRVEEDRRTEILRLGQEWNETDQPKIPDNFITWLRQVQAIFGSLSTIQVASKEQLTDGLMSLHAFHERLRFVKGGEAQLPISFWRENNDDADQVRKTLGYLVHGSGEFVQRLHDVLYDPAKKLRSFGFFCALELYGTIKPQDFPPLNGRIAKALRYIGFHVRGA